MVLGQLFKPRAIAISENVEAVKASKKLTVFFKVESSGDSGGAVLWFKGQVFSYKWESFLYPDRENSTKEKKVSILSVSASSKEELRERVDRILAEAPVGLTVSVLSEPLVVAENCKELLALGAQKEGGLR